MRSVSGVDLLTATLNSSLSRVQKHFNSSNPASLTKKKLRREKRLANKLNLKFAKLKNPQSQSHPLLPESFSEFVNCGDWSSALENYQLEFEPVENEFSSFISKLKEKYKCLNPQKKKKKKSKKAKKVGPKLINDKKSKNNTSLDSETQSVPTKSPISEKDDDVDSGLGLEIFPANTVSLLQQLRKKRLEIRKERKLKKKAAKKLEEQKEALKKLKKKKEKIMKDMLNNSERNGNCDKNQIPQLPQPKITLYPREKIVQGWKQKYHFGCGFHNLGNSCYMNATLQALFHTPSFFNWLLNDDEHSQKCRSNTQTYQQCLVCAMCNTLKESLNRQNQGIRPIQIHNKLKAICKHFTHLRQEDAHEFLRYLLESMERSYLTAISALRLDNRSKETTPLGQIFGGYLRTEVTCLKCNSVSTTFQPLAELQLDIRHVTTLEDAMNNHFRKERLDNNDYKCEKCHTVSPATKQFSLEVPPIVLCLQLKRFTLSGGKINKPIHCNQRLNLNRFLHKSLRENHANVQYKLVGLVTHIGSSPNCGHYTAIAEASNGTFYQFDDNYVRPVSVQVALNTDAYVIIYEMESSPQSLKSGNNSPGLPSPYKSGSLPNGTKPTSTVTKPQSPTPFEHKKLVNPFLKTPVKLVTNGNGIAKSTLQNGMNSVLSNPSRLLNGYSSSLATLSSKERAPVSFNLQKGPNSNTGTLGVHVNPKIVFKNPNSVSVMPASAYLTNSSRAKLASLDKNVNGSNDSDKTTLTSSSSQSAEPSEHQNALLERVKPPNSLPFNSLKNSSISQSPLNSTTDPKTTLAAPAISCDPIQQSLKGTSPVGSLGHKETSAVKVSMTPSKLVAYDSDDDDDDDEPATPPKVARSNEDATKKELGSKIPITPQKFYPIFGKSPNIKSWNGTDSALSTSLDATRKRSLEKSKEDLHNEELDAGKVKKAKSSSRSKSRSPVRGYPRHDRSTPTKDNKFQRFEDHRRSSGEQIQSVQNPSTVTSAPSSSFAKPQKDYSRNSYDGGRRNSDSQLDRSRSDGSSSSGDYFVKKGYHFNKHNYGYNNFKGYNQKPSYSSHFSSNSYNNGRFNRSYPSSNGWRNNDKRNDRGKGRYSSSNSYYRSR